jgi:hypothetical protein
MKMKEFFETAPPYHEEDIEDINVVTPAHITGRRPEIHIYCDKCGGERYFNTSSSNIYAEQSDLKVYEFQCKNCDDSEKYFTVIGKIFSKNDSSKGTLMKIGEFPAFGQPTPSKLIAMIGPDKDIFLKGRRCENQGLGVGAYAYYRRVIESQKNRIIDQMLKICGKYDNMAELIKQFEQAKKEIQFSKAVDSIKAALPSSLLIDNHNPLKLLHTALSKGIHEMSDDECLEKANSIRIVLTELCNRMNELLKDDKELHAAINLLTSNQEPTHAQA